MADKVKIEKDKIYSFIRDNREISYSCRLYILKPSNNNLASSLVKKRSRLLSNLILFN